MDDLLNSLEQALNADCIYAGFMSALCLPDICGYITEPSEGVGKRYANWFSTHMPSNYKGFVSPDEAYALRCVVLHNGELALTQFKNRSPNKNIILDKFQLTTGNMHLIRSTGNTVNGMRQPNLVIINVKKYSIDILDSVRKWEQHTGKTLGEYDEVFAIGNETSFTL